jgi:hypothetical protein
MKNSLYRTWMIRLQTFLAAKPSAPVAGTGAATVSRG